MDVGALVGDDFGDNVARVAAVQAMAASCSDAVPFLLMPVRVETRFVQVEASLPNGPTITAQLGQALAAAATAAQALAGADYVTVLPSGSTARRQFKRTVEDPIITTAQAELSTITTQLADAETLLHTVTDSTPADLVAVQAAISRLRTALPAAQAALGTVRSLYERTGLQTTLAAAAVQAGSVLAAAGSLPSDGILAALQSAPGSRVAVTADGRAPLIAAPGSQPLSRARLAETTTAHATVVARLDTIAAAITAIAAITDPTTRQLRLQADAPDLTARLDAARTDAAAIAVLPRAWHAELSARAAEVDAHVGALLAITHPMPASAALADQVGRLREQVAALPTDASGVAPTDASGVAHTAASGVAPTGAVPVLTVNASSTYLVDQLRVRIFPDDIAVLTHEAGLTDIELASGTSFWQQAATDGGDDEARRAAWRALVAAFGSARSAWIVAQTTPAPVADQAPDIGPALNAVTVLAKRVAETGTARVPALAKAFDAAITEVRALPAMPEAAAGRLRRSVDSALSQVRRLSADTPQWAEIIDRADQLDQAADVPIGEPPTPFAPADTPPTRESAWTVQPTAGLMPERFVVVTVSGGAVSHVVAGNAVPADLAVGLDPGADTPDETMSVAADGSVAMPASMQWLVDYDAAEAAGMAVSVPISVAEAQQGFDRVYVLGISGPDAAEGQRRLTELLDNHHYNAQGLALLPNGAPTNSTTGRPSAYRSDDDADRSFHVELGPQLTSAGSDGNRVATALGLPDTVLGHIEYADGQDIGDAANANLALWAGTAGYALEESLGMIVGLDSRDRLRSFALPNVLGRGVLSAIRVGPQPYGLLVASAYTRYVPDGGDDFPAGDPSTLSEADRQRRFELLLRDTLLVMHRDWTAARRAHVEHAYSSAGGQAQVLNVLGLDAGSAHYDQRFALNAGRRGLGIGPIQLFVGLPGKTADPAENAGAYALLERFQGVLSEAIRVPVGPLLTVGQISTPYAPLYDRLESSRSYEVRYVDQSVPLGGVTAAGTTTAHLTAMLAESLFDLVNDAAAGGQHDQALVELLVRQALLVEARDAAMRILQLEGAITEDIRDRIGSGDLFRVTTIAGPHDMTRWSFLLSTLSTLSGAVGQVFPTGAGTLVGYLTGAAPERRMHQFLDHRGDNALFAGFANSARYQPYIDTMTEHATAVQSFGKLPADRMAQLTLEHLDLCSYRLDAWLLGLATARLARMRAPGATPQGVLVGAFGWLDDLRPKPKPAAAAGVPAILNQDPNTPIVADPSSGGFIHAPSLAHASTAAILRAGYRAHGSGADQENRMAVNLTSARVQRALAVIDGVSTGNDLGALLGYQFERDLHDAYETSGIILDDLIPGLRAAFPSIVDVSGAAAANADRHVVDGLRLITVVRAWLDALGAPEPTTLYPVLLDTSHPYAFYPYGLLSSTGTSLVPDTTDTTRLNAVLHAIDRLADTLDALGDLFTVEGVHQLVEGNQVRAAAALSALGEGRVPSAPEVIDTPVEGTRVTHRVLLHLPITNDRPDGWTAASPRAAAEPALNQWVGTLIGPPGLTRARVVTADGARSVDVNLTALNVQPVDLLAILEGGLDDGLAELAARFVDTQRPLDVRDGEPAAPLQLLLERDPAWPAEVRSLAETAALVESLGTVVRTGRGAEPVDYALSDTVTATGPGPDTAELDTRRQAALAALTAVGVRLLGLLSDGADDDPAVLTGDVAGWISDHAGTYRGTPPGVRLTGLDAFWLRRDDFHDTLLAALGFGITSAVPLTTYESRDQVARTVLAAAESTLLELARRVTAATAQTGADGLRTMFGSALPVLAQFTASNAAELHAAMAAPPTSDPVAVSRWLAGAGPVRESLGALTAAGAIATAFGTPWPGALAVQLPAVAGEPWLAEAAPTGPGDRVSLVLLAPEHCTSDGTPMVALLVDQFTELIPATHATTGVSFNYDQPDAMAPQTMLLAVPPQVRGHWVWEDLVQTLDDTLELAMNRAVEPAHLQDDVYGQLLPAVIGDIPPYGPGGGASDHRVVLDFGTVQPQSGGGS